MAKNKLDTLQSVEQGNGTIVVSLTRDFVRPETLPDTRQYLVNAISIAGGHRTLIVDVSALDHKDMLLGLKYRDGLTGRDVNPNNLHNLPSDDNMTIIKELLYINKIMGFLGKTIIIAGADKEARQHMKKSKLDRLLTCKDSVQQALGEMHSFMLDADGGNASDAMA